MKKDTFYITTPIYYVNDKPHIGHGYTTILADVLARYNRLLEVPTFFLTGTDEHGQKVQEAANKNGISALEQCNRTVVRFQELWEKLDITHDAFIRTTQKYHKGVVNKVLQDLYEKDLIYKADYKGYYCVSSERFFTEKDLVDGNKSPESGEEVQEILETNYFFRMSQYQDWLIDYINKNPDFIQPDYRRNETLGFLKQPLEDLCISRPKSRLKWGIELPFDSEYVCYVWFDALINYISGIGYGSNDEEFKKWWPASYHLIGKDILTTHTVYWPTMLKAMGLEMPKTIFAHGWWLTGKDKMSKSKGNVVNPIDMCHKYGVDAFRYFLLAEMSLGQDASFTADAFTRRYNAELANDLGNILNRVNKLIFKYFDGIIPEVSLPMQEKEKVLRDTTLQAVEKLTDSIKNMRLDLGLKGVFEAVRAGNKYLEQTAPWKLAKEKKMNEVAKVLYSASESLRIISGLLFPVMPSKMTEMREALGITENLTSPKLEELNNWGLLKAGSALQSVKALFPRIETEETKEKKKKQKSDKKNTEALNTVTFDDFLKIKLKTARIISAEKIEKANRLLKLQIEIAGVERQIVAGIAEFYEPDELIDKNIIVVSNLKPAKIMGIKSDGMLLAGKTKKDLKLIIVDEDIPTGTEIG